MTGFRITWLAAALLAGLAGCAQPPTEEEFRAYTVALQSSGKMREDRTPIDAPFSNADLERNFREIMFYDEYVENNGGFHPARAPRKLEKWTRPIRYEVFGDDVTPADVSYVRETARRLTGATGLKITSGGDSKDVSIGFLSPEGMEELADWLDENSGRREGPVATELRNSLGDNICVAFPFTNPKDDSAPYYIVVIPSYTTGLLRRSCIEEEFGQTFGPAADYEDARPSIFNDNSEFALMTTHDELLLRILYDPRLSPGMTEEEGMPIVRRIIAELRPDADAPAQKTARTETNTQSTTAPVSATSGATPSANAPRTMRFRQRLALTGAGDHLQNSLSPQSGQITSGEGL